MSRIAGRPNAKLMMAPITAKPAAIGIIRLAVYVQAPSSTAAVPNRVPSFQPWRSAAVACIARRNIAPRIDASGVYPSLKSITERNTLHAARTGTRRAITKLFTKLTASFANADIQPFPMPPPGIGAPTPQNANHPKTWGRVIITMAQNIHFENPPPPTENDVVPSRRNAIPARTRATREAGGGGGGEKKVASRMGCGGP